jgi:hypothetical protein
LPDPPEYPLSEPAPYAEASKEYLEDIPPSETKIPTVPNASLVKVIFASS